MRFGWLFACSTLFVSVAQADGDPAMGKRLFAQCMSCHTIAAGAANQVGPNLHGIVGRKAATAPDFAYSDALKNSGIVWTDAELDAYLKQPAARVPGNKMVFMGIAKDQQRADIIAYLDEMSK